MVGSRREYYERYNEMSFSFPALPQTDRPNHSDLTNSSKDLGKRTRMKVLLYGSAMKMIQSFKVQSIERYGTNKKTEQTCSGRSNSSMSNSIRDDEMREQDEIKKAEKKTLSEKLECENLQASFSSKKLKTRRKADGKSKGRIRQLRRSGSRKHDSDQSSTTGFARNTCHYRNQSNSSVSYRKMDLQHVFNEEGSLSEDEESLLQSSVSSFSLSEDTFMNYNNPFSGVIFNATNGGSHLELNVDSMVAGPVVNFLSQEIKTFDRARHHRQAPSTREILGDIAPSSLLAGNGTKEQVEENVRRKCCHSPIKGEARNLEAGRVNAVSDQQSSLAKDDYIRRNPTRSRSARSEDENESNIISQLDALDNGRRKHEISSPRRRARRIKTDQSPQNVYNYDLFLSMLKAKQGLQTHNAPRNVDFIEGHVR